MPLTKLLPQSKLLISRAFIIVVSLPPSLILHPIMRLANKVNPQQVLLNKAPEILERNCSISKTLGLVVFKLVMHSLLDTAHSHSQNTPSPGNARKTGTNTCRPRGGLANHVTVVLASPQPAAARAWWSAGVASASPALSGAMGTRTARMAVMRRTAATVSVCPAPEACLNGGPSPGNRAKCWKL